VVTDGVLPTTAAVVPRPRRGLNFRRRQKFPCAAAAGIGAGYLRLTEHPANGDVVVDLDRLPLSPMATAWSRRLDGAGTNLVLVP
jgi:hypothetical protein